jgi:hypothetical protein
VRVTPEQLGWFAHRPGLPTTADNGFTEVHLSTLPPGKQLRKTPTGRTDVVACRTGAWSAVEQFDMEPDVILAATARSGIGQANRCVRHLLNAFVDPSITRIAPSTSHRRPEPARSRYPTPRRGRIPAPRFQAGGSQVR